MPKLSYLSRLIAIFAVVLIVGYVFIANTVPFSIAKTYKSDGKKIMALAPSNRIETSNGTTKQLGDLVYFYSPMSFKFNQANVKVTYKNLNPQQQILLGYQDQQVWHYNMQVLDDPLLDTLKLSKIGKGPYLYQKNSSYKSVEGFFNNPPQNKVVGIADYSDSDFLQPDIMLPNYQPAKTNTTVNVPLRGKITMYTYLNNEPFNMSFTKQDLNWYPDPDTVKISVYKGQTKVYSATIDDDGNSTDDHNAGHAQSIDIKNPGPGLPENGVYKIVVDAQDSLITNIQTNLHKIAFGGPLYVAGNHEVYDGTVKKTNPTVLTTNAPKLSFRSNHGQSKIAMVDKQIVNVAMPNQIYSATNPNPSATITIPNSDMIVNGSGYFAFSPDQFFAPTPYKILPINSADDIAQADYILTNYTPPTHDGDWLVATRDYSLNDAVVNKRQLSWVLEAPGLKENNHTVEYKQIDMTLSKKGWFKQ